MMKLGELVERYRKLAGEFGVPVALEAFGFSVEETERVFSGYDEDYHISRFLHFAETEGKKFTIDGIAGTHVSIDREILEIL